MRQMLSTENINCCQVIVVSLQQFFKNTQEGLFQSEISFNNNYGFNDTNLNTTFIFLHLMIYSWIIRCTQRQVKMPCFSQLPHV